MHTSRPLIFTILLVLSLSLPAFAQSRRGELRGVWIESGWDHDWPQITQSLADNGFNALFANFSTGDAAFYPSTVLTRAQGGSPGGDELAAAASAARQHNLELHVWRINLALLSSSDESIQELEAAGRLQRNHLGQLGRDDPEVGVDWLCPSHPENRRLEREAAVEIVRDYDVAGLHLDYLRFPKWNYCFCDRCKARFQRENSVHVQAWPDDVLSGGPQADRWQAWRRALLTDLAEEISDEVRRAKPDAFVSLAAWPDLDAARDDVAQEWPAWVSAGLLDFVCPMDYSRDSEEVSRLLSAQAEATRGVVPLYAGLGAFRLDSASALIDQIEVSREAGADGFVVFSYSAAGLADWLPELSATVTASPPAPMPHHSPPARIDLAGPAVAPPASGRRVIGGAELQIHLSIGGPSSVSSEEETGEGAAQAASILRRATDARAPVTSYDSAPGLPSGLGEEERISGRVVVETPAGLARATLSAFDSDLPVTRDLRLLAPEGPFRLAVYGSLSLADGERHDFVVRSPLLTGMTEEEMPEDTHAALDRIWSGICSWPEIQRLLDRETTVQIAATGPSGGQWWLRTAGGRCESGAGAVENPDLTFQASAEDLLAVLRGEADMSVLWNTGRLTVSGDLSLLQSLM